MAFPVDPQSVPKSLSASQSATGNQVQIANLKKLIPLAMVPSIPMISLDGSFLFPPTESLTRTVRRLRRVILYRVGMEIAATLLTA